jgi:hypothetical protein
MTLRATLEQEVIFSAKKSYAISHDNLLRVVGNKINRFSKTSEIISLPVPNTLPVVHNSCPNIDVQYFISITLEIPRSFDLHCDLPVIITNQFLPLNN